MNEYEKMGLTPEQAKIAATTGIEAYHLAMLVNHFAPFTDELHAIAQRLLDDVRPILDTVADTKAEDRQRSRDDVKRQRREMRRRKVK